MRPVGATLAYDVDLAGGEAVFSRVGSALHLEFLNRILRQDHGRRNQRRVGVDQPVEGVVVAFRPSAIHADGVAFALAHCALLAAHCDGAGAHQKQLHEVASVQRKLFHLLLAYQLR